jgi:hypothetical protein
MKLIDYFLLRAVPDRVRGEFLNVGIVIFADEKARVFVTYDHWRLRALHPNFGVLDIQKWATDLESELNSLPSNESRHFFLSAIGGPIIVDEEPGQLVVDNQPVEELVKGLLERLVVLPQKTFSLSANNENRTKSKLNTQLKGWFRSAHIFSSKVADVSKGKVVASYPISASEDLYADFALRNGAIHIIETMDFRGVERPTRALRGEAGWKSVLLDQARQTLSEQTKRIAVISADDYSAVRPLVGMVERYADDLISMESATDRQRLADFISKSLHLEKELSPSFSWII